MFFKKESNYVYGNFNELKNNLDSYEKQRNYYNSWLRKYRNLLEKNDDKKNTEWKIREWRAIKELYASAILFNEAEIALKNRCTSSFYFLCYYSLFHSMLSAICFDVNIDLKDIINIGHSKLVKQFKNTYSNGRNAIISEEIEEIFKEFKYLREYYSYTPPLNMTKYADDHLKRIDNYLTQCFQLTNLQSLILEKSYKESSFKINLDKNHLWSYFEKAVAKEDYYNPGNYELDPADQMVLHEILRDGIEFTFISIQLDHTYDEFRLYNGSSSFYEDGIGSNSIYRYIYKRIM